VKLPYPKAVLFIVTTEFCERFSFYGMKGIWDLAKGFSAKIHIASV
jgi:dipeptide/tripeptide permease